MFSDDAKLEQQEGVVEGNLLEVVVAAGCSAVAGVHVDVKEQRRGVGLKGAQLGDVLDRLPEHDLRVVEAGLDQHRRDGRGLAFGGLENVEVFIRRVESIVANASGSLG